MQPNALRLDCRKHGANALHYRRLQDGRYECIACLYVRTPECSRCDGQLYQDAFGSWRCPGCEKRCPRHPEEIRSAAGCGACAAARWGRKDGFRTVGSGVIFFIITGLAALGVWLLWKFFCAGVEFFHYGASRIGTSSLPVALWPPLVVVLAFLTLIFMLGVLVKGK